MYIRGCLAIEIHSLFFTEPSRCVVFSLTSSFLRVKVQIPAAAALSSLPNRQPFTVPSPQPETIPAAAQDSVHHHHE